MANYRVRGDWGSTQLRLFRVAGGEVTDQRLGLGILRLQGARPEYILAAALSLWRRDGMPESITLCGMVGSRNGWREAPYAPCPCRPEDWRLEALRLSLDGAPVVIAAGLSFVGPNHRPDVMRGEETQIFGALATDARLRVGRHLIALPGTHSKWVVVEDGAVTEFRTYPTGELFALLREHSSLVGFKAETFEPDAEGFNAGLARIVDGQRLLGALFEARSAQLLAARSPAWAMGFISGVLIGSEVAEALAAAANAAPVLIGEPQLLAAYEQALQQFGRVPIKLNGQQCSIAGLELLE
jgi:2-dehydro-3-deoxygalactonokinase